MQTPDPLRIIIYIYHNNIMSRSTTRREGDEQDEDEGGID